MDIHELNNLLRPYKITIECNSCETVARQPFQPRSLNQKIDSTVKKIKKMGNVKPNFLEMSENKHKNAVRKCKTERKPRNDENFMLNNHSPVSNVLRTQEQLKRQSNFFMELKQSGDKFLNCPRFENPQNNENFKPATFDYEATAATLNTEANSKRLPLEDIGSLRKNLFDDVNFCYGAEMDNCAPNTIGTDLLFENEAEAGFELDFGHMPAGAEFFNFA